MNSIKNILATAVITLSLAALTACTADEVANPTAGNPADAVGITATVATTVVTDTRADGDVTDYQPGFSGAILTLFYGSISADNESKATYTYTAATGSEPGVWDTTAPLYWNNLDAMNTATTDETKTMEYPFFAAAPAVPVAAPAVIANQSIEADYTAADQLIAYTATTERRTTVDLTLRHALSQITVNITTGTTDAGKPDIIGVGAATLSIDGAKIGYTMAYNKDALNPGVSTATGDAARITPLRTTPNDAAANTSSFAAIVPTQTFEIGDLTLTFTIDGNNYTWTNKEEITLATGTRTHIAIKAAISSVLLGSVSVAPWADATNTIEGSINTDDVQIDANLSGITEAGMLDIFAYKDGSGGEVVTGNYPIIISGSTASINKANTDYRPIKWADLTDKEANYTYTAFFSPTRIPATNHESDILDGVSVDATAWGTRPTIALTHLMARLVVKLSCTDGTYTDAQLNAATLTVKRKQKIDSIAITTTGATLATIAVTDPAKVTVALTKTDDATFSAILCPQTLMSGTPDTDVLTLSITTSGGVAKTYTMKKPVTLVAGNTHIVNAKLSASSLVPGSITVTPWDETTEGDGSLEIQ